MTENNLYYSIVWNTELSSNQTKIIKGEKITKFTKLPKDPRMLYGTNNNDVAKIHKEDNWMEIQYDIATQKQSVRFWKEIDEYVLTRDLRIIVWQGSDEISLPSKLCKIVSPDLFEYMCETCCENEIINLEWSENKVNEVINLINYKPIEGLKFNYDEVKVTPNKITYKKRIDE